MKSESKKKPYSFLGLLSQKYVPISIILRMSKIYVPLRYYLYYKWVLRKYLKEEAKNHTGKKRILFWAFEIARDSITFGLLYEKLKEKYWMESCRWRDNYGYQKLFKPDLIIAQELRNESSRYYVRMVRKKLDNVKVITLNGEGTIHKKAIKAFISSNEEDGEMVAGPKIKEIMVKYGRNPDKIHVLGNPRFDIYPNKKYMKRMELCDFLNIRENKPIILYATNFVLKAEGRKEYMPGYPYDKVRKLKRMVLEAMLNIALKNQELQFIIKLHPKEEDDIYSRLIKDKGANNCLIIGKSINFDEIPIYDIIPNSDVLIGFTSTVLVEGWICNKPTISCQFLKGLDEIIPELSNGCDIAHNEKELEKTIQRYIDNPVMDKEKKKYQSQYIADWLYKVDGKRTVRVVEFIEKTIN
jgi:surface carbohydrate biosynthesis protein